jgi:RimJ/RimL family protein N-acetyltransferase
VIATERLWLRPWRKADREAYLNMSADPSVMDWLGGPLSAEVAQARFDLLLRGVGAGGVGRLAIERKADGAFIGYCGLTPVAAGLPVSGVEASWCLTRVSWGFGYASEAARAVVRDGLERLGLEEIIAFTARTNARSQAVMARSGFVRDDARDFDHPNLPPGHGLRRHWVYAARQPQ